MLAYFGQGGLKNHDVAHLTYIGGETLITNFIYTLNSKVVLCSQVFIVQYLINITRNLDIKIIIQVKHRYK